jgi:tRNA-splicing ligase RtcB
MSGYERIPTGGAPIKAWTGVPVEAQARRQLENAAGLPFVHHHVAVMPDVHWGLGATVGSVIPCKGAIVPAAVGVDIGCGMMAVETSLTAQQLPDNLAGVRTAIETAVPHGRTGGGRIDRDQGAWREVPAEVAEVWTTRLHRRATRSEGDRREASEDRPRNVPTAPGYARHWQPLHGGLPGRERPGVGDAALRLPRHRQPDRHLLHRAR